MSFGSRVSENVFLKDIRIHLWEFQRKEESICRMELSNGTGVKGIVDLMVGPGQRFHFWRGSRQLARIVRPGAVESSEYSFIFFGIFIKIVRKRFDHFEIFSEQNSNISRSRSKIFFTQKFYF